MQFKGFWNPAGSYQTDDLVEYFNNDVADAVSKPYGSVAVYKFIGSSASRDCPLTGFTHPVVFGSGVVGLSVQDLEEAAGSGAWDHPLNKSYPGPHGFVTSATDGSGTLGASVAAGWQKVAGRGVSNPISVSENWSTLSSYEVVGQYYDAKKQHTLKLGKYDPEETSHEISFDEVQGETDSDSYYLSSVQNYKGYYDSSSEYKKFDVVRDKYSNLFYYARENISPITSSVTSVNFSNIMLRLPTDFVSASNHVGTIERDGDAFPFIVPGQILDFNNSLHNQKKFVVLAYSSDLIFLGSYGVEEKDLVTPESFEAITCALETASIELNTDPSGAWSVDKFFFDADYGSTVNFLAKNKQFEHGDGYKSVSPVGINSMRMQFDLKFTNRSNREANAILHFIENKLGQHETNEEKYHLEYDQGLNGFSMDNESLFFPYNSTENLGKKFHCLDFSHSIENEDVHTVELKITNSTTSLLTVAHQIFVKEAPLWQVDKTYLQHGVVFCPDNQKYYYSYSDSAQKGNRPWVNDDSGAVSINRNVWTREFYWSPSISFDITHSPKIDTYTTSAGGYTQYHPSHQQNINSLKFSLKFENRTDEEAYSILHFLETHLGYLSFLFVPPAPYNRKRRFFCESWSHTYVFRNNHTIEAEFEQFPLGQNTPLDDDEIDKIAIDVPDVPGQLLPMVDNPHVIHQKIGDNLKVKIPIILKNTGDTPVTVTAATLEASSSFTLSSNIGRYKPQLGSCSIDGYGTQSECESAQDSTGNSGLWSPDSVAIGDKVLDNYQVIVNHEDGSVVYLSLQVPKYAHTSSGQFWDLATDQSSLQDHPVEIIEDDRTIDPGEQRILEAYYESSGVTEENPSVLKGEELVFTYTVDGENKSAKVPIQVAVNPERHNPNKKNITIQIEGSVFDNVVNKNFDVHDNISSITTFSQVDRNLLFDIAASASGDGMALAVPESIIDFEEILNLQISEELRGYMFTGLKYDSVTQEFYSYYNTSYTRIAGSVGVDLVVSEIEFDELSQGDKGKYQRSSSFTLSAADYFMESGSGFDGCVALHSDRTSDGKFRLMFVDSNDKNIKCHVRELVSSRHSAPLNIAEYISASPEMGNLIIEEVEEFNITMVGLFAGSSRVNSAVSLGQGFSENAIINLTLGTDDSPCYIVGKGGNGGNGMFSEGTIYENGEAQDRNSITSPPINGSSGGDALHIDHCGNTSEGQISVSNVTIKMANAAVLAGGGGGGGGGYQSYQKRVRNSSLVNFAGGGGAGAGGAQGGFPFGENSNLLKYSSGSGGYAKNNSQEHRNHLSMGGAGGGFGQDGFSGGSQIIAEPGSLIVGRRYKILSPGSDPQFILFGASSNLVDQEFSATSKGFGSGSLQEVFIYNRVGDGGKAGKAITWDSTVRPKLINADGADMWVEKKSAESEVIGDCLQKVAE